MSSTTPSTNYTGTNNTGTIPGEYPQSDSDNEQERQGANSFVSVGPTDFDGEAGRDFVFKYDKKKDTFILQQGDEFVEVTHLQWHKLNVEVGEQLKSSRCLTGIVCDPDEFAETVHLIWELFANAPIIETGTNMIAASTVAATCAAYLCDMAPIPHYIALTGLAIGVVRAVRADSAARRNNEARTSARKKVIAEIVDILLGSDRERGMGDNDGNHTYN